MNASPLLVRTTESGGFVRTSSDFANDVGHSNTELDTKPLVDWIHPDDRARLIEAMRTGDRPVTARHITRAGTWLPLEWRFRSEIDATFALATVESPRPQHAAADDESITTPSTETLDEMLDSMARIVESKCPGLKCSILLVDPTTNRVTVGAGPSLDPEYNAAVEGLEIGPTVGSCGTAACWNVPVIVEDIAHDPLWRNLKHAAALAGVAACWSQPIRATDGHVIGAMALYDTQPGSPSEHHLNHLEIAARMVGLAIERLRLESKLREATKMEALGVLAGGVAHDFNNLLAVIQGNAELAIASNPPARSHRMLHGIIAATESATALCNQMLAYAGRGSQAPEYVDCNEVVESLSELLRITLSKKAQIELDLDGELGVIADRSQLRQVVMNLITNASEAIGNREGRVEISTRKVTIAEEDVTALGADAPIQAGEFVEILVRDTGCGMDAATRSRLFDPFFTTKSDGRGLGMAAVRGIVTAHHGALTVESEPGVGTTFRILLPSTERPPQASSRVRGGVRDKVDTRVLVVDDEPAVLDVVSQMLEHAGMTVLRARDGVEAIDTFRRMEHAIDCVLLDLNMPKLDGEEVFRELKKVCEDVRVVLSSGFTEREVLERFDGAGLAGVVQKPVRLSVLVDTIQRAVDGE